MATTMVGSNARMAGSSVHSSRTVSRVPSSGNAHRLARRGTVQVTCGMKDIRDRIKSIGNTKKITDAMKLVAAAKVRRAQEAVVNGRPFAEQLVRVLYGVNQRLRVEDVDSPLCQIRPVKTVLLVVLTGDRGLCGGYNNFVIKKTEQRYAEITAMGVNVQLVIVGRKGTQYFKRRPKYKIVKNFSLGQTPTIRDAQSIADEIFSDFVSAEVDKVELVYTKFVSLINSNPTIQTMLPLTPTGALCDLDGKCVDASDDEVFKLTTTDGRLTLERESAPIERGEGLEPTLIFEQDPVQILDALLPLYMNSVLLRSLQEALASELAARMNAMSNASDNAKELKKALTVKYNRKRQAAITQELNEICGGANA